MPQEIIYLGQGRMYTKAHLEIKNGQKSITNFKQLIMPNMHVLSLCLAEVEVQMVNQAALFG